MKRDLLFYNGFASKVDWLIEIRIRDCVVRVYKREVIYVIATGYGSILRVL